MDKLCAALEMFPRSDDKNRQLLYGVHQEVRKTLVAPGLCLQAVSTGTQPDFKNEFPHVTAILVYSKHPKEMRYGWRTVTISAR
jgi:hypothetical protein